MFSDSFAGIAAASAPAFVLAQFVGAGTAVALHAALQPRLRDAEPRNAIEASGQGDHAH